MDYDIVGFIANETEEKGLFEDAVKLFDLGGVSIILCKIVMINYIVAF